MSVCAIVVSHSGAAWLPQVLRALADQTHTPQGVVAVDTGSRDESVQILRQALGASSVVEAPRSTSFGQAVDLALPLTPATEWVWLLHDDSAPAPDALAHLLEAATSTGAAIVGPKLREWPSLRRLLEVGVTIGPTGQRETGLERGEYDQGQHDTIREVLAVNTAGMLVRRDVLVALGGFDRNLPIFGNDIDFGWRAANAGHATVVAPQAIVFHVEAAHRGIRSTPLTGRHRHYQERRAALFTLLANRQGWLVGFTLVRLLFGSLVRVAGLFIVRQPGQALDELAAVATTVLRPGPWLAARRARRAARSVNPRHVRRLLSPWWLPYRHGLDWMVDTLSAVWAHLSDVAERRQSEAPSGFLDEGDDGELSDESSAVWRWLGNPVTVGLSLFVIASLVAGASAIGALHTNALPPVPDSAGSWWRLWTSAEHPLGWGSTAPAAPYVPVLAALGSVVTAGGAVAGWFVLAGPAGLLAMWWLLRSIARLLELRPPQWLLVSLSALYAVLPALTGAFQAGRLDVMVTFALVPWLASAGLGLGAADAADRWQATWRVGLVTSLLVAFAPMLWLVWVGVTAGVLASLRLWGGAGALTRSLVLPGLVIAGCPLVASVSWWLPLVVGGQWEGLLVPFGDVGQTPLSADQLLRLHLGERAMAPYVVGGLAVLAALVLAVARTRVVGLFVWMAICVAAVLTSAFSRLSLETAAGGVRPNVAPLVAVILAGLLVAAATTLMHAIAHQSPRVLVAAAVAVVVAPLTGLVWWLGPGRGMEEPTDTATIPAYLVQTSNLSPDHGVVLIRSTSRDGVSTSVLRSGGQELGESEVIAMGRLDPSVDAALTSLASAPTDEDALALAAAGVDYVVLLPPLDRDLAARLDSAPGLTQASAPDRSMRAWDVTAPVAADAVEQRGSRTRWALVVFQGAAFLLLCVLAGPRLRREQ